jgi:hypothetical protein
MSRRWQLLAMDIAAVLAGIAGVALLADAAVGDERPQCTHRQIMASVLKERFQESPVAAGISEAGALVEIWATSDGQGWTMTITRPDGQICMVVSGRAWQMPEPGRPI